MAAVRAAPAARHRVRHVFHRHRHHRHGSCAGQPQRRRRGLLYAVRHPRRGNRAVSGHVSHAERRIPNVVPRSRRRSSGLLASRHAAARAEKPCIGRNRGPEGERHRPRRTHRAGGRVPRASSEPDELPGIQRDPHRRRMRAAVLLLFQPACVPHAVRGRKRARNARELLLRRVRHRHVRHTAVHRQAVRPQRRPRGHGARVHRLHRRHGTCCSRQRCWASA